MAKCPDSACTPIYSQAQLDDRTTHQAAAGTSTWSLAVPNDLSLVGAQFTVQGAAASADPTAWNGIALSNGPRGTVGAQARLTDGRGDAAAARPRASAAVGPAVRRLRRCLQ